MGGFYWDCLLNLIYKAWVLKNNYYCLQANSPQQLKKFYEKSKTVTPKWVNNDKFIYPCTCKDILIGVHSVLFLNELTWSFLVQYFLTAFQRVLQVTWKTFLLGCSKETHETDLTLVKIIIFWFSSVTLILFKIVVVLEKDSSVYSWFQCNCTAWHVFKIQLRLTPFLGFLSLQ